MTAKRKPNGSEVPPPKPLHEQPLTEEEKREKERQDKLLEERYRKFQKHKGHPGAEY